MLSRLALGVALLLTTPEYFPRTVKAPAGRYYGVKQLGTDPYNYDSLELVIDVKGGAKLTWVQGMHFAGRRRELELTEPRLDEAGFSATVKGETRPPGVGARWIGKFMTKTPGANAKGAVEPGILFPDGWFLKVSTDE